LRPSRSKADPPAALNSTAIPAVANVEFLARGRDGIEVSMRFVHVWTVRQGQIVRFRGFGTFDEALEAVGLQE
jgi:ketosteroid isomerase-like protein